MPGHLINVFYQYFAGLSDFQVQSRLQCTKSTAWIYSTLPLYVRLYIFCPPLTVCTVQEGLPAEAHPEGARGPPAGGRGAGTSRHVQNRGEDGHPGR